MKFQLGTYHLTVAILVLVAACGGRKASPAKHEAKFSNPGGMWMPEQLGAHGDTLRDLKVQFEPAALADPSVAPLNGVVSLGGCSASFVSPKGLIITNHHCVQGALQYHSSKDNDLITNGFVAETMADEKWNGPSAKVWVTESVSDVTEPILKGLSEIADGKARFLEFESREKKLVKDCEQEKFRRCSVVSFFGGAEFRLIRKLEIRDVRLVYAPHKGIGFFGGDIDNWMWPRHTGDFAFYRAYVGPDGKPAEHSDKNIPFVPPHYFKLAKEPLQEGDFVMVAGYPGRTSRLASYQKVQDVVEEDYPEAIVRYKDYIAAFTAAGEADPQAKVKGARWIFGLQNALKNREGMLEGLVNDGLKEDKAGEDKAFRQWVADKGSDDFKTALKDNDALYKQGRKHKDLQVSELFWTGLFQTANTIVRMAEERPKPDAAREIGYQERDWKRKEQGFKSMSNTYNEAVDRAAMTTALLRATKNPQANGEWLKVVTGESEPSKERIAAVVDEFFKKTQLDEEGVRLKLLKEGTTKSLTKSEDPFIRAAVALRPMLKTLEDEGKQLSGEYLLVRPQYMAAFRAFKGTVLAPDANSSLRITFGTVKGYKSKLQGKTFTPFTFLKGMVAKHTGEEPFNAPKEAVAAASAPHQWKGPQGQVPVNFLADLDITGGNSGSATLNRHGDLIGLVFDGNYESIASDWVFSPPVTRSIHVHINYILWVMEYVDKVYWLMDELGASREKDNQEGNE